MEAGDSSSRDFDRLVVAIFVVDVVRRIASLNAVGFSVQLSTNRIKEVLTVPIHPNTLRQGDCIKILSQVAPATVDLVFADPPFNIGYEYDTYDDRRSRDEYLAWCEKWIAGVARALKPNGTFWLAIGDEFAAELKLIAQDKVGFTCRSWVIWYYTFGVNCVRGFSRSHTHLFHFVKDPSDFTFNGENPTIRVLSARQLVYADGRANPKGRLPDNTWILRPQDAPLSGFAPMHDTWYFARVAGTFREREGFHTCQMPEQLLGRIIKTSSNPQDVVLDPFSGSGTTLAVAKKLGRRWIGVELSREYVRKIQERLASTNVGDPLEGPADPVRSAPRTAVGRKRVRIRNGRTLPECDEDTERGIVDAFRATCGGNSADHLLCDPELNLAFVAACKKKRLQGDAFVWNRLLLRIRKKGSLPRVSQIRRKLSFEEMDAYSFASEIAMELLGLDYGLKLDDILCSPLVAKEFDQLASSFGPNGVSSFEYRWAALAIRKRATQSKSFAREHFQEYRNQAKRLPRPKPFSRFRSADFCKSGVYVVSDSCQTLYIGETVNLRQRVELMLDSQQWTRFELRNLQFIPTESDDYLRQHGLQSALIGCGVKPPLNSRLLYPALEPAK